MHSLVIIGAGPQGLAAAAHALERGLDPLVLESGPRAAAAVSEWGHVRLFSPWTELVDPAAARLLAADGRAVPENGFPTGAQWIAEYLEPLATVLGDHIRVDSRVVGVARKGRDLAVDDSRSSQPFTIQMRSSAGEEELIEARAVIDASGTWSTPSPAGGNGLPALGEAAAAAAGRIDYRIPDAKTTADLAGRHTVIIGNGHSAATAITQLAKVAETAPGTRITWVLRRGGVGSTFGGGSADELPERGALGERAAQAVKDGLVDLVTGFRTERIEPEDAGAVVAAEDGRRLDPADRIIVLTGFRPDLSFLTEIRLALDVRLQAPLKVAEEVDPNVHSCGSVRATGAEDLAHPEPDFYLLGAKSYGRAPTFLALTGYEQVRSVVAEISGDHEAAARVELALPDTGVCGGSGLFDAVPPSAIAAEAPSECCAASNG